MKSIPDSSGLNNPLHGRHLDNLAALDWDDIVAVDKHTRPVLECLSQDLPRILEAMIFVRDTPELGDRCVSDGFFDRVVLYEDKKLDFSVRLHFLAPMEYDRPHNHRATFATRLIAGSYQHTIYSLPFNVDARESIPPMNVGEIDSLRATSFRVEEEGSNYVLHHSGIHSTIATADHASIVVRGPSAKDRLLFIDQKMRTAAWMYGGNFGATAALEVQSKASLGGGKMSLDRLSDLISRVRDIARRRAT